jgi:hypothetical protein
MKIISFTIFAAISLSTYSQVQPTNVDSTSLVVSEISKEWKSDSLGQNGYRLHVYERLLRSQPYNISKVELFNALGKPYHVTKFYSGNTSQSYISYQYIILCLSGYPKDICIGSYIEFVFDDHEINCLQITQGHLE